MLYIPVWDDDWGDGGVGCDGAEDPSALSRQVSLGAASAGNALHPATPATAMPAPSLSCFSLEVQTSYEAALEKELTVAVLRLEHQLATLRPEQPLKRPRGMELAPYRPAGPSIQEMAERSLMCEWSLVHNFDVACRSLLSQAACRGSPVEVGRVQARQCGGTGVSGGGGGSAVTRHLSPLLNRAALIVTGEQCAAVHSGGDTADRACHTEAMHGGYYDATSDEEDGTRAPSQPADEVLVEDRSLLLDLTCLQGCMSLGDEDAILQTWKQTGRDISGNEKRRRRRRRRHGVDSPHRSLCEEVVDVAVQELWASAIPRLAVLVPSEGIAARKHLPRSGTANSSETDSTAKGSFATPSCHDGSCAAAAPPSRGGGGGGGGAGGGLQRPHTGDPRTTQRVWAMAGRAAPA
eukprot:Rhum_TRINITY_DN14668_c30_g1::Rhum_TRINITY_DN14668_c30_g1_i1::g.109446::m.109446